MPVIIGYARPRESLSETFQWTAWYCLIVIMILLGVIYFFKFHPIRSQTSSMQAAQMEMKAIADAERQAEIDTGYYVTLAALSDMPGYGSPSSSSSPYYGIQSEPVPFAIDTDGSFSTTTSFPYKYWKGPYITFQKMKVQNNPVAGSGLRSPLDPWGHHYRYYTHKMLTNPAPGDPLQSSFDRLAIVSYGADGMPGSMGRTQVGTGDDMVYRF